VDHAGPYGVFRGVDPYLHLCVYYGGIRHLGYNRDNRLAAPFFSLIIPAHDEEHRLPDTLKQVAAYLQAQPYEFEVLLVENSSTDNTLAIAQAFAAQNPQVRVLQNTQRGKGLAVKRGMLEARGEYRFMCDADLSMPITEIGKFIPPALTGYDIVIASREAPGSIRYNEPIYRHLGGRGINLIIRLLALPGLQDSQCGFKCFTARAVEDLFRVQTLNGWSFDIELLFVARMRGYRLIEVPIHWYFQSESKVHAVRDALRMVRDIFTIRRNARRGLYGGKV
jgi:dolichyl-phosphate beta-glucosyltransferase